jgi:hypothetical protein
MVLSFEVLSLPSMVLRVTYSFTPPGEDIFLPHKKRGVFFLLVKK